MITRTLMQHRQQLGSYDRELVHMLMAIHEVGLPAHYLFESIELGMYLRPDLLRAKAAQPACAYQTANRQINSLGGRQFFRKIQMQAYLNAAFTQRRPVNQARGSIQAPQPGKLKYRLIDGFTHAVIVGTNHQFFSWGLGHVSSPDSCSMTQNLSRQLVWFVLVGCSAAATHWMAVVLLVSGARMEPLAANVLGWLLAFGVSFGGHYLLTFRHQQAPPARAALRFFGVSALGFAVNEAAYAWLLHATTLRYDILLAGVLVAVAFMTFILGKFWAFSSGG